MTSENQTNGLYVYIFTILIFLMFSTKSIIFKVETTTYFVVACTNFLALSKGLQRSVHDRDTVKKGRNVNFCHTHTQMIQKYGQNKVFL